MDQMPTSNVDEEVAPDIAPSEKSVKPTLPETETEEDDGRTYLIDEMGQLPDLDLLKIGLASLALLHQRATNFISKKDEDDNQKAS